MLDWEVKVVTQSNYIQNVKVTNCMTREDAEASALGMTGAERVINSNPKTFNVDTSIGEVNSEIAESYYTEDYDNISEYEDFYESLDEMEQDMYDLMCPIAMEKEEEMPTIQEFYDYLNRQ